MMMMKGEGRRRWWCIREREEMDSVELKDPRFEPDQSDLDRLTLPIP
jgi:hypothetical protein